MGDATERLAVDRWLDGEHGWLGLCERLDIGPSEASSMRRAAIRAALDALETVRLRRRAESGEALAVELLAERVALRVDPLGIDERVVERLRAMAAGPEGVEAEQRRQVAERPTPETLATMREVLAGYLALDALFAGLDALSDDDRDEQIRRLVVAGEQLIDDALETVAVVATRSRRHQEEKRRRLGMGGSRLDAAVATLEGWRSGLTDAGDAAMRLRVLGFGDLAEAVAGSDRRRREADET